MMLPTLYRSFAVTSSLALSSSLPSAAASPSPERWQKSVKRIPLHKILPSSICLPSSLDGSDSIRGNERKVDANGGVDGNDSNMFQNHQRFDAWRGDKLLGAAASKALAASLLASNSTENVLFSHVDGSTTLQKGNEENKNPSPPASSSSLKIYRDGLPIEINDPGSASKLTSVALSNAFLAKHFATLLPDAAVALSASNIGRNLSDREKGTILEAAVAQVSDAASSGGGGATAKDCFGDAALVDLASWLLEEALQSYVNSDANGQYLNPGGDSDAKGQYLNRGGEVIDVHRIPGTPDHAPVFEATATLDGNKAVARGRTRKRAEFLAVMELLQLPVGDRDEDDVGVAPTTILDGNDDEGWTELEPNWQHDVVLKGGETALGWWQRGAFQPKSSVRRAIMAPTVFPCVVASVGCWTRTTTTSSAVPTATDDSLPARPAASFIVIVYYPEDDLLEETQDYNKKKVSYYITSVHEGRSKTQARILASDEANKFIAALLSIEQ